MKRLAKNGKCWATKDAAGDLQTSVGTTVPAETASPPAALAEAARLGDADAIRSLLDRGANPLEPDAQGQTPLALAFRSGSAEAVALLLSSGSTAYLDPSLDLRAPASPSTLDESDWLKARAILDALFRSRPDDEPIVFAYALSCISARDYAHAEFALGRLVAVINPANLRARRELAQLYILTGRPALARRELDAILSLLPDSPMRQSVRSDLDALAARDKRWTFGLRLKTGFVYDDNANAGPSSDIIEVRPIQLGPLTLDTLRLAPESKPASASGAYYSMEFQTARTLGDQGIWDAVGEFGIRGHYYPDHSDYDSRNVEGGIGLRRNLRHSASQAMLSLGYVGYGHDSLLRYAAIRPSHTIATGAHDQWWWTTEGLLELREYETLTARDGQFAEVSQSLRHFFGPSRHHLGATLAWQTDQTDSGFYRYNAPALELGGLFVLPARLSAYGKVRWLRRDYSLREPLAPCSRVDNQWTWQAGVRWRVGAKWELDCGYQRLDTDSTFDLYDVERNLFTVGITCLLY